jgi:hypothetical protein
MNEQSRRTIAVRLLVVASGAGGASVLCVEEPQTVLRPLMPNYPEEHLTHKMSLWDCCGRP